jgi:hypothetical protein
MLCHKRVGVLLAAGLTLALPRHPIAGTKSTGPFSKYEIVQYIVAEGPTPQTLLDLDNNRDIAFACREGITREGIAARGIPFSESQLRLLEIGRVLSESNDTLELTFPVLDSGQTSQMRQLTRRAAERLTPRLTTGIKSLVSSLARNHREANTYSILFSYVLDGLVWDKLEQRGEIHPRQVDTTSPFWSGEVWALYSPRNVWAGTNSITDNGLSLNVTWTEAAIPKMIPFVTSLPTLAKVLDDYAAFGRVENSDVFRVFGDYGLFSADGTILVPIITEDSSQEVYTISQGIADVILDNLDTTLGVDNLVGQFGFRDRQQAIVIGYHELMWDLLDILREKGLVRLPVAFEHPATAKPTDIAAQVFITKNTAYNR